ncbi:hypothetical protein PR048_025737 [Dryococelus australis]|uniref:Uncharacterized protein n=1 Tax=Dryococelus australis TaxID=614101 RepID=A0ABQ9GJD8_9NEOP|nr:hypothetical protein PR048_025737 [Dryococelus australis]
MACCGAPNHRTWRLSAMSLHNAGCQTAVATVGSGTYAAIVVGPIEAGLVQNTTFCRSARQGRRSRLRCFWTMEADAMPRMPPVQPAADGVEPSAQTSSNMSDALLQCRVNTVDEAVRRCKLHKDEGLVDCEVICHGLCLRPRPAFTWSETMENHNEDSRTGNRTRVRPNTSPVNYHCATSFGPDRPQHVYTEVTFAIGYHLIRQAQDDPEPIADLQGNKSSLHSNEMPDLVASNLHRVDTVSALWPAAEVLHIHPTPGWRVRVGRGKRVIPKKTRQPTQSSGTITISQNAVTRLGIEPGSPWWEASVLIAQPPWPQRGRKEGRGRGYLVDSQVFRSWWSKSPTNSGRPRRGTQEETKKGCEEIIPGWMLPKIYCIVERNSNTLTGYCVTVGPNKLCLEFWHRVTEHLYLHDTESKAIIEWRGPSEVAQRTCVQDLGLNPVPLAHPSVHKASEVKRRGSVLVCYHTQLAHPSVHKASEVKKRSSVLVCYHTQLAHPSVHKASEVKRRSSVLVYYHTQLAHPSVHKASELSASLLSHAARPPSVHKASEVKRRSSVLVCYHTQLAHPSVHKASEVKRRSSVLVCYHTQLAHPSVHKASEVKIRSSVLVCYHTQLAHPSVHKASEVKRRSSVLVCYHTQLAHPSVHKASEVKRRSSVLVCYHTQLAHPSVHKASEVKRRSSVLVCYHTQLAHPSVHKASEVKRRSSVLVCYHTQLAHPSVHKASEVKRRGSVLVCYHTQLAHPSVHKASEVKRRSSVLVCYHTQLAHPSVHKASEMTTTRLDFSFLGAAVAKRLGHSHPTKSNRRRNSQTFARGKWESCRTMPLVGGFPRGSPVSPTLSFQRSSIPRFTLIGSHDLTKNHLKLFVTLQYTLILGGEPVQTAPLTNAGMKGREKREIPEKTRRPAVSSGTIRTCENLGVTRPGVEPNEGRHNSRRSTVTVTHDRNLVAPNCLPGEDKRASELLKYTSV